MRSKLHQLNSYRQRQMKLKLYLQRVIWALIVLARLLSFLNLILSCYLERF